MTKLLSNEKTQPTIEVVKSQGVQGIAHRHLRLLPGYQTPRDFTIFMAYDYATDCRTDMLRESKEAFCQETTSSYTLRLQCCASLNISIKIWCSSPAVIVIFINL
jgi:hypothetical protein